MGWTHWQSHGPLIYILILGGTILQIGTDGGPFLTSLPIDSDTLSGNSSTSIHSGESLKAYIDTQDTSGTITLSNKTFDLDANTLTGTLTEFSRNDAKKIVDVLKKFLDWTYYHYTMKVNKTPLNGQLIIQ